MTPESAVLARVFVEQCISTKNEARLESASLPVLTAFAFHIQEAYNSLLAVLEEIETAKLLRAGLEDEENDDNLVVSYSICLMLIGSSAPPELNLAKAMCSVLEHLDTMRVDYWNWRKIKLPLLA